MITVSLDITKKLYSNLLEAGFEVTGINYDQNGHFVSYYGNVKLHVLHYASYQRQLDPKHYDKIKVNWNYDICGPLKLNFRPTESAKIWGIDGQHRACAGIAREIDQLPAVLHMNKTYAEEAKIFFECNDSPKKMDGWVKYYAALAGGEHINQAMLDIAHKLNLTTPDSPGIIRAGDADVRSSKTLMDAKQAGGLPMVKAVLEIMRSWKVEGRMPKEANNADIIRGLCSFLKFHYFGDHPLPWATIMVVLRKTSPLELMAEAKKEESKGRPDARQVHDALSKMFGRTKGKTPPRLHESA